jgi:hypothetical protein
MVGWGLGLVAPAVPAVPAVPAAADAPPIFCIDALAVPAAAGHLVSIISDGVNCLATAVLFVLVTA